MISVTEALQHIRTHIPRLGTEALPIADAKDRTLAEPVRAKLNMPPFQSSSMDGYATGGCQSGDILKLIGESSAGSPFNEAIGAGETVRISTGAVIPQGANRILIQENAVEQGDTIKVISAPNQNAFVRDSGCDFQAGETLLTTGTRLGPTQMTLIAAANVTTVKVIRRPKIALISSGNELRVLGSQLQDGEIVACNAIGLTAALENWGAEVTHLGIAQDNQTDIQRMIHKTAGFDIIVTLGGASIGDHDLMRPAFQQAGFEIIFSKVAVKPGKPCWLAKNDHQVVFGLPGNPASALVCAQLFLRPLLGRQNSFISLPITVAIEENGPRETYLRGRAEMTDGHLAVTPYPVQESFRLKPQAESNALIRVPPMGGPYKAGDRLDVMRFGHWDHIW